MTPIHARFTDVCLGTRTRAWIRSFVITILLVSFPSISFALEPLPPPGAAKVKSGFAFMAAGMITTGVGAAVYMANEASGKTNCTPCAQKSAVFPVTLMAVGGAMFVAGTTLFTIGLVQNSRSFARTTLTIGPLGGSLRMQF